MGMKTTKVGSKAFVAKTAVAVEGHGSEADFDDTIAKNRALPLLDPESIPARPKGFVSTDPKVRLRRLRRLADEHRAEGHDALVESSKLDLRAILGKRAPDPRRAAVLAERMSQSGALVARAERLLQYAKEMDEIALSDALLFLDAVNKEQEHEASHDPDVSEHFRALIKLYQARSSIIVEGIARRSAEKAAAKKAEEGDEVVSGESPAEA
jgi:hypothetical protein